MTNRAERRLLAQLVAGLDIDPAARVRPDDFSNRHDGEVWRAGLSILDGARAVSDVSLESELQGNDGALAQLAEAALYDLDFTNPADIAEAAQAVRTSGLRRRSVKMCRRFLERLESPESPTEVLGEWVDTLAALTSTGDEDGLITLCDAMIAKVRELKAEAAGERPRAATDIASLDSLIGGGFGAGWQVVVGARPKMGKSAFALQVATAVARAGGPVIFFSHEMSSTEIGGRSFANMGDVDIQTQGKTDHDWQRMFGAADEAKRFKFDIVDRPLSITALASIARRWRREHPKGLGLIVVDYLQLVEGTKDSTREQEIAAISRRLKNLARETGCVTMVLSQLNRGLENRDDKRPRLSDLRESGSIEQDADLVLFLFRPFIYDESQPIKKAEIIVSAFRHGFAPCTAHAEFNPSKTRFE